MRTLSLVGIVTLAALVAPPAEVRSAVLHGDAAVDPLESPQWTLEMVNASAAWSLVPGHHDVVVAFVDTGLDLAHPDLQANLWDGNLYHGAFVGEPVGWATYVPSELRPTHDDNGHGTLVAGVVGATSGNAVGIRGVADVPIMLLKFAGIGAPGTVEALAAGIVWAVDHGARVVSVSQTTLLPHAALEAAVLHAEAKGAVVVAASGNDGSARINWPASYPTVVSVGAVDATGAVWSSSNHGKVDIAAPGVDVVTTALPARYASVSGTSVAAPHVAGAAALVLAADPTLTPAEVRDILLTTARPTGDPRAGAGIVDAGSAVQEALA